MKTRSFIVTAIAVVSLSYFYPRQGANPEDPAPSPRIKAQALRQAPSEAIALQSATDGVIKENLSYIGEKSSDPQASLIDARSPIAEKLSNLQVELNQELSSQLFSQNEIDLFSSLLAEEFRRSPTTIDLTSVLTRATEDLHLSPARREELKRATLQAIAATHSRIRYEDISACMGRRLQKESDCVKNAAEDILRQIAANSDGNLLDVQTLATMDANVRPLKEKAQRECQRTRGKVEELFDLYLTHC